MKRALTALMLVGGVTLASWGCLAAPKIALEFGGTDPVKHMPAGVKAVKVADGFLMGTISASDPSFGFDFTKLKVSTEDTPLLGMLMKVDATSGKPFGQLKLYFSTTDSPALAEDKTVFINDILCDGEWHEYKAEMDSNKLWTGNVKQLRIDFEPIGDASYAGTIVYMDWLHMDY